MTVEERLDYIERLHAEHAEMSRQDRAAYIAWKRDMESQVKATWMAMERAERVVEETAAENRRGIAELRAEMRELGVKTDERIARLVTAIGEFISAKKS
jgi:hypothetical protein